MMKLFMSIVKIAISKLHMEVYDVLHYSYIDVLQKKEKARLTESK